MDSKEDSTGIDSEETQGPLKDMEKEDTTEEKDGEEEESEETTKESADVMDTTDSNKNQVEDKNTKVVVDDDVVDLENVEFALAEDLNPDPGEPGKSQNTDPIAIGTVKIEFLKEEVSGSNMKEEILAEDDNNIVGILSEVDSLHDVLEEDLGAPTIDVKVKIEELNKPILNIQQPTKKKSLKRKKFEEIVIDLETAFTDQEDMALHSLDLISPYDMHFISSHLAKRTEKEIEKRLDDNVFRKKHFLFHKVPSFLFCMTFYNAKLLKFRALVNITEKLFSLLICVNKKCVHPEDIPEVNVEYMGSYKFGIDLNILVEFINENVPNRWKDELYMTTERLERILIDSKLSFHKYGTTIGHVVTKNMKPRVRHKLKKKENPMRVLKGNRLGLDLEHEATLVKIVSAIGQRWDMVLTLMNETYGKMKAQGPKWTNEKLQVVIKDHFLCHLDDRKTEPFTDDEDKCLLFLHKFYFQQAVHMGHEEQKWKQIARHMEGRTMDDCRERLKRKSTSKHELTLDNLDLEELHDDVPSLFFYNESLMFGLTVIPKDESLELLDVPTRLQMESRFIIAGTIDGVYVLPCKESAMRCSHTGLHTMQFTYNPAKPESQFETYLKLTFCNELKKAGLIDEAIADSFNFNQIKYFGKSIHEIIDKINKNRFILPREHFMQVNEKEDQKVTGGKRGFTTEAYYLEDF
eukprot:TRINITY_DN9548_c0_g1_i1.p1 TRINITY_DN9548_c0_g1~~TRINITY_DN9548_c0_g1_i1.p1  ORF type:complete len:801 (-),score=234.45 TRINITY_DN9548_c0_g1_i1:366-2438(-)